MSRRIIVTLVAAIAAFLTSSAVVAQSRTVQVDYRTSCATCEIELERLATLGRPTDPELIYGPAILVRDSQGRFLVAGYDRFRVVVFDSAGRYLTAFGNRGQGPGEFGETSSGGITYLALGPGDSLIVFTGDLRAITFSPQLRFVRQSSLPISPLVPPVLMRNGDLLLGGLSRTRELIGKRYHIVDSSGVRRLSFGDDRQPIGAGTAAPPLAQFALARNEQSLWTTSFNQILEWNLDGTPGSVFAMINVPWMSGPVSLPMQGRAGTVQALASNGTLDVAGVDSSGIIWVNGTSTNRPPVHVIPRGTPRSHYIMAVDSRDGSLAAVASLAQNIRVLAGGNFAVSYEHNSDGTMSFVVWSVRLSRS